MKTRHIHTADATRGYLYDRVTQGDAIHGSPYPNLDVLKAHTSKYLHVDDRTGEQLTQRRIVAATGLSEHAPGLTPILVTELAIFYAAIHSVMRDSPINGSTSIKPVRRGRNIVDYKFFLDDGGKEYIEEREQAGGVSAVYFADREKFEYVPSHQEYAAERDVPILGSVAVTSAHLLLDIHDLLPPESDPEIAAYRAQFNSPPETSAPL